MKKLFNYKTLLIILCLFITSCGFFKTELVEHEGQIHFEINEQYLPYMPYDTIPSYDLKLPQGKKINTTKYRSDVNEVIFSGNDDFVVSEMLSELFAEYKEKGRLSTKIISTESRFETHLNQTVVKENGAIESERAYLKVKDAKIYNEIAYITLENGLQLTTSYARFEVETEAGIKTYYTWQYSESIRMILYFPLMVVQNSDQTKNILIIPLPNGVINTIETRYEAAGLIKNDDFLKESYYTYEYADYNKADTSAKYDNTNAVASMREYYNTNYKGREVDGKYMFTYLGFDFMIEFGNKEFIIRYIEKTN